MGKLSCYNAFNLTLEKFGTFIFVLVLALPQKD